MNPSKPTQIKHIKSNHKVKHILLLAAHARLPPGQQRRAPQVQRSVAYKLQPHSTRWLHRVGPLPGWFVANEAVELHREAASGTPRGNDHAVAVRHLKHLLLLLSRQVSKRVVRGVV